MPPASQMRPRAPTPRHDVRQKSMIAEASLAHDVNSALGVTVGVRIVDPGAVERSQGKAKRVVDLRAKA